MENKPTYEQLEKRIAKLEYELKATKKYGLVWDKENIKEEVVQKCEKDIPVLVQDKSKKILSSVGENNILIEGDNYHVLTALNFIAKESIDVVYIDPPYNKEMGVDAIRKMWEYELLSDNGIIIMETDTNEDAPDEIEGFTKYNYKRYGRNILSFYKRKE